MKFHASLVNNRVFVSTLLFSLLLAFKVTTFSQTKKDCFDCPCCGDPARCATTSVYAINCEKAPNCDCNCEEPSCNCNKNICDVTCYPVSNKKNDNKSLEIGLITLSLIIKERITTDDLEKNRKDYFLLIDKLLSNKISENTYQVEYESRQVKLGFAKEGLSLIAQFKENLENGTQNSPKRSKNIFVIIWEAIS